MKVSRLHIKNELGQLGEELAAHLLEEKRYTILERNWKIGPLEIDLIAQNEQVVAFVEVKTRSYMFNGKTPEEYVDREKQMHLCQAANAYIKQKHISKRISMDVIGIVIDSKTKEVSYINHIKDAYTAPLRTIKPTSFSGGWGVSYSKNKRHGF